MWKRRWRDRLGGWDRLDEGSARTVLTLGQVNPSVSLFELTTNYWSYHSLVVMLGYPLYLYLNFWN